MDKLFAQSLGKLLIVAMWADDEIQGSESIMLKQILSELPRLNQEEWALLKLYMQYPLSKAEIDTILIHHKKLLVSQEKKDFTIKALKEMIYADGNVDPGEIEIYKQITEYFASTSDGALGKIGSLLKGSRVPAQEHTIMGRERFHEDFMNNPIFFRLYRSMGDLDSDVALTLPKDELRKMCLATVLFTRLVFSSGEMKDEQRNAMVIALQEFFSVSSEEVNTIVDSALNIDEELLMIYRTCRLFNSLINADEKIHFLKLMADVTKSNEKVTSWERKVFRDIAVALQVNKIEIEEILESLTVFENNREKIEKEEEV